MDCEDIEQAKDAVWMFLAITAVIVFAFTLPTHGNEERILRVVRFRLAKAPDGSDDDDSEYSSDERGG